MAQAVLRGRTRGYRHHPQLERFRRSPAPVAAIGAYLGAVHAEAERRGYRFDRTKLPRARGAPRLTVTRGQLEFEWEHLRAKLAVRDPAWLRALPCPAPTQAHPGFRVVAGGVEAWERGGAGR